MTFAQILQQEKASFYIDNEEDSAEVEAIKVEDIQPIIQYYLQKVHREHRLDEAIYELSNLEVNIYPKP